MAAVGEGATILVTGAGGFIGAALCRRLIAAGHRVVGGTRMPFGALPEGVRRAWVPGVGGATDWTRHLDGVDAVVHLAAPAHITRRLPAATAESFRRTIVDGTEALGRAVASRGLRLVFVSTAKVHGERTTDRPFVEDDPLAPGDLYAQSKAEAERRLARLAEQGLDHVVLRPPLVYGPGAKGNLRSLVRLCDSDLPLPFATLRNRRSLIHLDSLADAILTALRAPRAGGRTYLVADENAYSTRELAAGIRRRLGRSERFFTPPGPLVALVSLLPGMADRASRLFASLAVDTTRIRGELDWRARATLDDGLARMIDGYRAASGRPEADGVAFDQRPDEDGVSVVVVSYRNAELPAVLQAAQRDPAIIEIIVVDNGNDDRLLARVEAMRAADPRLRLISGHGNVGFATGCNIGAAVARGRHLLLLNPDCHLGPDSVTQLTRQLGDRPGLWVCGVRLINSDGSEQRGARRNIGTPLQWLVEALHFDDHFVLPLGRVERVNLHRQPLPDAITEVPAISGAFMFMPRRSYEA
ncbi:MAG: NAD-dependent epimerase/dehydratase family protein, partial [Alphaproteobacteria bacterium]|nr:NAD-dependent epimerase/dehydratase family protein [Alphaproteobacteria bacterium]